MKRDPTLRICLAVGFVVAVWTAAGAFARATDGARTTADEPQYLLTAISLGEDGDLDIADEIRERRARAFHEIPMLVQAAARDDGSRVSPHDPALPALLALPVRAGGWLGAKVALAGMAGVLAATTLWVAVRRFAVPRRVATITVLATSTAAPLAVYGTQVYPELPAALVVVVAIAALTGPLDRRGAALLAGAVVVLPWLSVKYAPVATVLAGLGTVRLAREGRRRTAVALAGVLVVAAAAYLLAHQAWYGGWTAYAAGSHFRSGELAAVGGDPDYAGRTIRLGALLLDESFGLAAWQPLYLLLPAALGALLAARPRGATVLALPLATGWATATWIALTMHGWWFPGRQVVHVLPAAVVLLAWFAARRPRLVPAYVACGVLGASLFAALVVEALLGRLTIVVTFNEVMHPLAWLARTVLADYRSMHAADWALHFLWLAALGAGAVATYRATRRRGNVREVVSAPAPVPDPTARLEGALT